MTKVNPILVVVILLTMFSLSEADFLYSSVYENTEVLLTFPYMFEIHLKHPWDDDSTTDAQITIPEKPWGSAVRYITSDQLPKLINPEESKPLYPIQAIKAGITGTVEIEVKIDEEGIVRDLNIVKESDVDTDFKLAVLIAINKRKYLPAKWEDKYIPFWIKYRYDFSFPSESSTVLPGVTETIAEILGGDEEQIKFALLRNEAPRLLNPEDCQPDYPEMAAKLGLEGVVWI